MFSRDRRWRVNRRRQVDQSTLIKIRLGVLLGLVALAFLILSAQLLRMQVLEGKAYAEMADANRLRVIPTASQRGIVYDRSGFPLVKNIPDYVLAVTTADLPKDQQRAIARKLGVILRVPVERVEEVLENRRTLGQHLKPIPIARLDRERVFAVKAHQRELPGISVLVKPRRYYSYGTLLSQVLGYVGRVSAEEYDTLKEKAYEPEDWIGKVGVELGYEDTLRGAPGWEQVEINANGDRLRTISSVKPQRGSNLVLSIDLAFQEEMTRLLQGGMGESLYAAAIAMDPKTGEVLGLVSLPSYDSNVFTSPDSEETVLDLLSNPRRPLLNYAIGGIHPPGSIFKIVTGSAALQEGVASPSTRIVSTGKIEVPNQYDPKIIYTFPDWAALGSLDFYRGVAMFYYLAGGYQEFRGLGIQRLAQYARRFGLGEPTGIDLPGEIAGLVPDPSWKEATLDEPWLLGDTYNLGIGQGYLLATPMQMLTMVSAVANGGVIMKPQIVREV
ncbi:MAG: Penicillin-binding protein 2, partial [Dehalococcoidia bacterium]|nr:Penicillin-binding protein 2 [Dehalococcoidia bacterium]